MSVNLPVDHHRDSLPGSEGCHTLQLLVSDPYRNQKLLRVAGAQPEDKRTRDIFREEVILLQTPHNQYTRAV